MQKLDRNFVFIHIPKAGGTSITELLFETMEPTYPREKLFDYPLYHEIDKPGEPSLFISHFGYNFYRGAGGYCMTVLREPVERILSLYSYWKNPGDKMPPGDPIPADMTLEEFLDSGREDIRMNVRDAQTWQLAFSLDGKTRQRLKGIRAFELFDIAKTNLDAMDIVGVLEKPDELVSQLAKTFPSVEIGRLHQYNVTSERVGQAAVSETTIAKIRDLTFIDDQLYRYAVQTSARRAGQGDV